MKHILTAVVLAVVLIGLIGWGVDKYVTRPKSTALTASQAVQERNSAVDLMNVHDAVNKAQVQQLTNQITNLNTQKTSICGSLKTTKVVNALCQ